jgi:hypothetical protein
MSFPGIVLEFLVIGTVSAVGVILIACGLEIKLPALPATSSIPAAFLGGASLLVLYYFGTIAHYITWIWWKPWCHRRWLRHWIKTKQGETLFHRAEHEFLRSTTANVSQDYPNWKRWLQAGVVLDWCRFCVFQTGSDELRSQYLRQFHLYRLAYGPLGILAVGNAVFSAGLIWRLKASDWELFSAIAVWILILASFKVGKHRVTRMWKYLAFSKAVLSDLGVENGSEEVDTS